MFHLDVVIDSPWYENEPLLHEVSAKLLHYFNTEFQKRKLKIKKSDKLLISLNDIPFEKYFVRSIPGIGPISFVYVEFDFKEFLGIRSIKEKQKYLFVQILNALEYADSAAAWGLNFKDMLSHEAFSAFDTILPEPDIGPIVAYYEKKIRDLKK